jgi:transposase
MSKTIVHHEGAASLKAAGHHSKQITSVIKLGLDIHLARHVVVAQYDHALPKPPRRFAPGEVVPWVESLRKAGHQVYVVYEACGFGFGLQRALEQAGATCYVIAPCKLDERGKGVKTDALDAAALCQRLSRYVGGNTKELAVIRVPSEEEEKLRHVHRQREALVRARTKLQAQGRGLLVNHGQAAPAHWWRGRTWRLLGELFPVWLIARLEVFRPILLALDTQIAALTKELEAAAPPDLPAGLGQLTSVVLQREVCDWSRFKNRRQVSSYTGLCPGEYSSGEKRVPGSVTKHGNPRVRAALVECAWRLVRFQPQYPPVKKRLGLLAKGARATGAARKKAIVAVARNLAVDLWRLSTGRCTAAQLGLHNLGSTTAQPEVKVRGEQTEPAVATTAA